MFLKTRTDLSDPSFTQVNFLDVELVTIFVLLTFDNFSYAEIAQLVDVEILVDWS